MFMLYFFHIMKVYSDQGLSISKRHNLKNHKVVHIAIFQVFQNHSILCEKQNLETNVGYL